HDASGNCSTGIIEAQVTSASRKTVPLNVSGITSQSGLRSAAVARIATHTARPITGMASSRAGNLRFATTLARIAASRIVEMMNTRVQSTARPLGASFVIGE